MTRIEKEKQTVSKMVELYCRSHRHAEDGLCEDCAALLAYAHGRLDRCRFGNRKSTCRKCPVHCYRSDMRERMRNVMRYAGPRMLWHHPIAAVRHLVMEHFM